MILVLCCLNDRYKIWDKAAQCLAVLDSLISLAAFRYTTNFAPVNSFSVYAVHLARDQSYVVPILPSSNA